MKGENKEISASSSGMYVVEGKYFDFIYKVFIKFGGVVVKLYF